MNIYFNINYQTVFGEQLVLNVVETNTGGDVKTTPYRMSTIDGKRWWYCLALKADNRLSTVEYYYSVEAQGTEVRREWTTLTHRLELSAKHATSYTIYNRWIDMPEDSYRYSAAFTECIHHHHPVLPASSAYAKTVRIAVRAPQLRSGQQLVLVGAGKALGEWTVSRGIPMTEHNTHEWVADIDADTLKERTMEFKFVATQTGDKALPLWEEGLNRKVELPGLSGGEVMVYELDQSFYALCDEKVAGTLVPVFSLRSKGSFGVGDFGDLRMMVDFVSSTHQRALQILPINDTTITHTWTDSYPYSCISIFALHPQYADLRQLPTLNDEDRQRHYEQLGKELNALPQIDYERVNEGKLGFLRELFAQEGKTTLATVGFKEFFADNSQWLVPYAQYCYLRDTYGTADFAQWPDHQTWDEADRKALTNPRTKAYRDVAFYYFVQYILFVQMRDVHTHARKRGVILKGDIPIGVNRHGCDVWMEPGYFHLDGQAGAPPDDFSVNGQNWGFPTYNWEAMLADGCRWWVRRFSYMARFFDAYRIDHVLGFFRIWEIPIDAVHGLLGQFSPSQGMTREEIEAYGLGFREELFTRPFITGWVLDRIFHEQANEVRERFLEPIDDTYYRLKAECDTQRKIEAMGLDDNLRDGLYALVSDVLFVRDRKEAGKYHPRISAQFDFVYESLGNGNKQAFNRLYDDYYYRRNNQFWYGEAMKKLPKLVEATRMLVCAEDLGMVPDCVAWVMKQLRILSLEIQSMPKDPQVRFGVLASNPYRSVCTISSHDMPTLRQWWDEDGRRTQDYYNTVLQRSGTAPHPLPGWLARDIVAQHLASPSMLCILSIQDWMAIADTLRLADANAERINIPANPHHYWRYSMHIAIEDLMDNTDFKTNISELILQSGRK